MSRAVELGRAVLCSPATNLELWLTTLITVSPEQDKNNFEQLKSAHLLQFLSSGDVWVRRGHGMQIQLKLTLCEDELASGQIQDLADAIIRAPVWEQLMLEATVPTDAAVEPGTICLDINHKNTAGKREEQKHHRMFSDVPETDVHPPDNVQSVLLQSVRLSMDILETNARRKSTTKRSSTDILLYDMVFADSATRDTDRSPNQKRKRPATENASTSQIASHTSSDPKRPRRRLPTNSFVAPSPLSDQLKIENLLDGALRLSICGDFNKTPNGLKLKASTFRLGLSDVAPILWKPGYLTALSQRAHLIPTIARSLHQVGSVRASSISLKDKISSLTARSQQGLFEALPENELGSGQGISPLKTPVAGRLWAHVQRRLPNKFTAPLQAFVASGAYGAHSDSNDMLAEMEHEAIHQQKNIMHKSNVSIGHVGKALYSDDGRMSRPARSAFLATMDGDQFRGPTSGGSNSRISSEELEDDLFLDAGSNNLVPTVSLPGDEDLAFRSQSHSHASNATALQWHEAQRVEHSTGYTEDFASDCRHLPISPEYELLQEEDLLFGKYGAGGNDSTDLILPT